MRTIDAGLFSRQGTPIPLLGVRADGQIVGQGARITVSQRFRNEENQAIEAVYKFPLPQGAAVSGFTVEKEGARISGHVEEQDFILTVTLRDPGASRAFVCRDEKAAYVQMDLYLAHQEQGNSEDEDIVFLVDCSGSMQGDSIYEARQALDVCLKALEEGMRFNIVRFGSHFESLFAHPEPYSEKTLKKALFWSQNMQADLGGTEILHPLHHIYKDVLLWSALLLQILERCFAEHRKSWESAVRKTRMWLDTQISTYNPTICGMPLLDWAENHIVTFKIADHIEMLLEHKGVKSLT